MVQAPVEGPLVGVSYLAEEVGYLEVQVVAIWEGVPEVVGQEEGLAGVLVVGLEVAQVVVQEEAVVESAL